MTADAQTKTYGEARPGADVPVHGGRLARRRFTGALTRVPGETVGTYAIEQGTLALSATTTLTYVGRT